MGGHGCSCAFMGAHWCSCLFDVFFPVHPFIDINIGFKRRSLSDCSTLDWIVFVFLQYIYIKVGEPQVLGKPWVWKTLCEITLMMGSNNLTNQNMSRPGWPFTCSGRNKSIKCLVTIGCIQSFLWYKMHDTKLLFLLHAPPLECNSCALANLTHHWGESPALTFIFMTIHDKTSKPQDLPMTWDDQPFYFWRQLNAHFTYNLGPPAFKFIEK